MNKLSYLLLLVVGFASSATPALVPANEQFGSRYIDQSLVRLEQRAAVGVLVDELWVITTASMAQCLTPQSTLTLNNQAMAIKQIYLEPDFQHKHDHDLALIELSAKITQATPLALQQRKKEQSLPTYLYHDEIQPDLPEQSHYFHVTEPLRINGGLLTLNKDQSALSNTIADSAALRLLFTDDPKGARLLGLTTSRFTAEQPMLFTRISHYHSWLNQVMLGSVSYRTIIATEQFSGRNRSEPLAQHCQLN